LTTPEVVLTEQQIAERVAELARQASADANGRALYVAAVLDNGFMFMTDLVRKMSCHVVCLFLKAQIRDVIEDGHERRHIIYTPITDLEGKDFLLVDAVLHTGVTMDHLVNWFKAHGARSVKTCVLIDKPEERKVALEPDYWGFRIPGQYLVGYGMGFQEMYRNLPYVGDLKSQVRGARSEGQGSGQ
jgi:hypoxanthine phosphoribosyltransferase